MINFSDRKATIKMETKQNFEQRNFVGTKSAPSPSPNVLNFFLALSKSAMTEHSQNQIFVKKKLKNNVTSTTRCMDYLIIQSRKWHFN
jgi:hypothetical protein